MSWKIAQTLILIAIFSVPVFSLQADHAININTASVEMLQELTGVGEVKAGDIVAYRDNNGHFSSISEIEEVSGIGPATFNGIKDHITVSGSSDTDTDDTDDDDDTDTKEEENTTDDSKSEEDAERSSSSSGGSDDYESKMESPLSVSLDLSPSVAVAGAPVTFMVDARIEESEANTTSFDWNLGDGTQAQGKEVTHIYAAPGTYVVVINAETRTKEARIKETITVHEGGVSIRDVSLSPDGSITLTNNDVQEYLLTGWHLSAGGQTYTIPDDTFIAGGSSITLPSVVTGLELARPDVSLLYPNGDLADKYNTQEPKQADASQTRLETNPSNSAPVQSAAENAVAEEEDGEAGDEGGGEVRGTTSVAASVSLSDSSGKLWPWLAGLLGVVALGILGFIVAKPQEGLEEGLVAQETAETEIAAGDSADDYEILESLPNDERQKRNV